MAGKSDPKAGKRVVDRDAIETKMMDELSCRACGWSSGLEAHHLVNRSQLGGDVPDNIVALCRACHSTFTNRGGKAARLVGQRIRASMRIGELNYIVETKGWDFLDSKYPLVKDSARVGRGAVTGSDAVPSGDPVPAPENQAGDSSPPEIVPSVGRAPQPGIPSETPYWLEPGHDCPTCHRRIPHPKKKTSPVSKVFSHRGPLDTKDDYKEILSAALKHGGMAGEEKYFEHEGIMRMCAVVLAGPPGVLVVKP